METLGAGGDDAALGDQGRHQTGRGDIKGRVKARAAIGAELHMPALAAEQVQLLEGQAVIDHTDVVLVLLQGALELLAFRRGLGRFSTRMDW